MSNAKTQSKKSKVVPIPYEGKITVDSRAIYQSATRAMQGNIVMALIELITNSDDSYDRLGIDERKIYITYGKQGRFKGVFSVKDDAAGQSLEELHTNFLKYWKESDLEDSNAQRGYFGKGAKDALACMSDGQIVSFKDGRFIQCSIFFDDNKEMSYKIVKCCDITSALRKKYGIAKNGTFASFIADPQSDSKIKVPQFRLLHSELSNHYLLRKILQRKNTTVTLINKGKRDKRRLRYAYPKGDEILSDSFELEYDSFDPFVIDMEVSRSDTPLSQKEAGDTRSGGLLVVDSKGVVLDISLFKYDYEDMAKHLFGEVVFNNFRKLLKANEIVLSSERKGLLRDHPLISAFVKQVEKRLNELIQMEKSRMQRYDVTDAGKEYQKRQRKFTDVLNDIASEVLDYTEDEDIVDPDIKPINGFAFDNPSKSVGVDKNAVFVLRVDTSVVKSGTVVKLRSTNSTIKFQNRHDEIVVPKKQKGSRIVTKKITIIGDKPDESGTIIATTIDHEAKGRVYINAPEDISDYGMAFQYEVCNPEPNKTKKVLLLCSTKAVQAGDVIKLESDNPQIHISEKKIAVEDISSAKRGVIKFEIEIWGDGEGQDGIVSASCDSYSGWESEAMVEVNVRYKRPIQSKSKRMTFSPAELRSDLDPPQASSFSIEMKKVFIYTKFPTVLPFVGDNLEYMNSLPGQMCIAQLTIEKYCYQLAAENVERSKGSLVSPTNKADYIQSEANDLVKRYSRRLMQASIDQDLLRKSLKEMKGKKK